MLAAGRTTLRVAAAAARIERDTTTTVNLRRCIHHPTVTARRLAAT
jgi:hypothetical protein